MIRLFRINDPLRIVIAFIFLVGMRLPFLLTSQWVLTAEVDWLIVGESLKNGNTLYLDVWSKIAPLAAGFYWVIVSLFGKSYLALRIISIFLITIQAYILNRALIRNDIYNEKTYLPALFYVLFMNISTDFMTLSPQLLSLTFLTLALSYILRPEEREKHDELLKVGIYFGLATFCYYPSIFFLLLGVVVIILFKASSARGILNMLFGFLFIVMIHIAYFFIQDSYENFFYQYLGSLFGSTQKKEFSFVGLLLQFSLPLLILLVALIRVISESAFVNYQVACQRIMLLWLIIAVLCGLNGSRFNTAQFIFLVPVFSFFIAHQFLLIKKRIATLYAYVIFIILFVLGVSGMYFQKSKYWPVDYQELWVDSSLSGLYEGKKIVVLGEHNDYYLNNSLATPYLDWSLSSKAHFSKMDRYSVIQAIHDAFIEDAPEVIIDEQGTMEAVFDHIPELNKKYIKVADGTYQLKE